MIETILYPLKDYTYINDLVEVARIVPTFLSTAGASITLLMHAAYSSSNWANSLLNSLESMFFMATAISSLDNNLFVSQLLLMVLLMGFTLATCMVFWMFRLLTSRGRSLLP